MQKPSDIIPGIPSNKTVVLVVRDQELVSELAERHGMRLTLLPYNSLSDKNSFPDFPDNVGILLIYAAILSDNVPKIRSIAMKKGIQFFTSYSDQELIAWAEEAASPPIKETVTSVPAGSEEDVLLEILKAHPADSNAELKGLLNEKGFYPQHSAFTKMLYELKRKMTEPSGPIRLPHAEESFSQYTMFVLLRRPDIAIKEFKAHLATTHFSERPKSTVETTFYTQKARVKKESSTTTVPSPTLPNSAKGIQKGWNQPLRKNTKKGNGSFALAIPCLPLSVQLQRREQVVLELAETARKRAEMLKEMHDQAVQEQRAFEAEGKQLASQIIQCTELEAVVAEAGQAAAQTLTGLQRLAGIAQQYQSNV